MRIAFVTPEYVTEPSFDGGLANYLARIAAPLAAAGHEPIVVVAAEEPGDFYHEGARVVRAADAAATRALHRWAPGNVRGPLHWAARSLGYRRTLQALTRQRPLDVVQYASYSATGLFRLESVPAVVRISSLQRSLVEQYGQRRTLSARLTEMMETKAISRADGVFGPSELLARQVASAVEREVEVIESPRPSLDAPADDTVAREVLEGKEYLLFFGSLGILKGVDTIAEMIGPLLDRHRDLHFAFAGKDFGFRGGPMIDLVFAKAGSHRDRVIHLGQLSQARLRPVIQGAVAVVLPSRIDNFPNACIEAMALGRIVIGTRGTSFEQLIGDGRSGLLVAPDDPEALRRAVEAVLGFSDEQAGMMRAAAQDAVGRLEPSRCAEALVEFYGRVIERYKRAGHGRA